MDRYPLLQGYHPRDIVAWKGNYLVTFDKFLTQVSSAAEILPDKSYVINLCQDRYLFLVGLAAALARTQITLLPQGRSPGVLRSIIPANEDVYFLTDSSDRPIREYSYVRLDRNRVSITKSFEVPSFRADQSAVIAFTSGSTGQPNKSLKTWGSLIEIAQKTGSQLGLKNLKSGAIVSTVPPQHMYGLETSLMLAIQHGWGIVSSKPFFPIDVRKALSFVPAPRILVTTPFHLRALVTENIQVAPLELIVSATAPLTRTLAEQAEQLFRTRVIEVYGFAEAGTIATRRPVEGEEWRLLDGLSLYEQDGEYMLRAPYHAQPVSLPDVISVNRVREFVLHGRKADFVKVGGQRVALGDLNAKLNEIEGVVDSIVFMPDEIEGQITRPAACVVAPGKTVQQILTELRTKVDAVLIPRPIVMVESLPRNETGKIARDALIKLMESEESVSFFESSHMK